MTRIAIPVFVIVWMFGPTVYGQTFSADARYTKYYQRRFNPDYDSMTEPTIAFDWIINQFSSPKISREELAAHLARHAQHFPDSRHASLVESHLKVVKRMLAEKRPPDEQIIEQLIFDLRDLNRVQGFRSRGPRFSHRVSVLPVQSIEIDKDEIFPNGVVVNRVIGQKKSDSDADQQLFEIGYDAIPFLIDHIDDDTLTRSVDYRVLTVGEFCRQIIHEMLPTGRMFDFSTDPETEKRTMKIHYGQMVKHQRAAEAAKEKAKATVDPQ